MGIIKKYELGRVEVAFIILILIAAIIAGVYAWKTGKDKQTSINSYAECVAAGNPVMESYPTQCAANGQTFTNPDQVVGSDDEIAGDVPLSYDSLEAAVVDYCNAQGALDTAVVTPRVQAALADTSVTKQEGDFASTKISCLEGEGSLSVVLRKSDDKWYILDGSINANIDCDKLDGTGIPASIAGTCLDETGEARAVQ